MIHCRISMRDNGIKMYNTETHANYLLLLFRAIIKTFVLHFEI